jgi:hypothetical protein
MNQFNHITEYFDYILECRVKKDHEEAWVHFNFLSHEQKKDFIEWVETSYFYEALDCDDTQEFINIKQYFNL